MAKQSGRNTTFGNLDAGKSQPIIPSSSKELMDRLSSGYYTVEANKFRQTNKFIHRRVETNPCIWWTNPENVSIREEEIKAIQQHHLSISEREKKFADEHSLDVIEVQEGEQQRILTTLKQHQDELSQLLLDSVASITLSVNPAVDKTVQTLKLVLDDNEIDYQTKELWAILNKVSNLKLLEAFLKMFDIKTTLSKSVLKAYIQNMFVMQQVPNQKNSDMLSRFLSAYAQKQKPESKLKHSESDEYE